MAFTFTRAQPNLSFVFRYTIKTPTKDISLGRMTVVYDGPTPDSTPFFYSFFRRSVRSDILLGKTKRSAYSHELFHFLTLRSCT